MSGSLPPPEFITTNNLWSLYEARDLLGNTYILYGDQFFTVNPFEPYVYRSFYATTLTATDDAWVVETDTHGVVTDMLMREDGGEKLQGPCYVDAETGAALAAALDDAHSDRKNKEQSWEFAWYLHRDTVNIVTRYFPEGVLNSFKSMDELKAFDDSYLLHVKSPSMDNICGYFGCAYEDLYDFEPLTAGMTNYSCAFSYGDSRYVYRHPIGYAPVRLDRSIEALANEEARKAGVDSSFIYEDPEAGWKLSYFIKGVHGLMPYTSEDCTPGTLLIAKFQEATKGITVDAEYDRWDYACDFERQFTARGAKIDDRTMSYYERYHRIASYIKADNFPKCLSHNDAWYGNMLYGEDGSLYLIDWEFAAMADYISDLANHVNSCYTYVPITNYDLMRDQLKAFLGRKYTLEEYRHLFAMVMIGSWKTLMWLIDWRSADDNASDWDLDLWMELSWGGLDVSTDNVLALYEDPEAQAREIAYAREHGYMD